jgi:hypothetical protein
LKIGLIALAALLGTACASGDDAGFAGSGADREVDDAHTVRGTVVAVDGSPVAHAKIRIAGQVTETDERGRFRAADVPSTYEATLVRAIDRTVFSFPGLTQRAPKLWLYEAAPAPRLIYGTTIRVTIGEPSAPGARTIYFADLGAPSRDGFALHATPLEGGAELTVSWSGTPAASFSLYALRYETDGTSPHVTRYSGIASTVLQTQDARPTTWRVDALRPVGTKAIVTQIRISGELDLADAVFGFQLLPTSTLTVLPVAPPSSVETIELVPDLPGASFVLAALGTPLLGEQAKRAFSTARVAHAASDDTKMEVRLMHALRLLSPEAKAPRVDRTTSFTWEPSPEARTHIARFEPELLTPVVAPDIYVQTAESSARIPDTADLGVPFPSGATYTWQVFTPSWTPDPGTGAPQSIAGDEDRVSISELRHFTLSP